MILNIMPNTHNRTNLASKRQAARKLLNRNYANALIYVPFSIMEVIWDLTETMLDLLIAQRVTELKHVSRSLRCKREDYLAFHRNIAKNYNMKPFIEWKNSFMEASCGMSDSYSKIRCIVKSKYPDLGLDWTTIITQAALTLTFTRSLLSHWDAEEKRFASLLQIPFGRHIYPDCVTDTIPLLEAVMGDKPISRSELSDIEESIRKSITEICELADEPAKRADHRHNCIAYRMRGGCRRYSSDGKPSCPPSANCARMSAYDNRHDNIQK